jgi:hypothetical protein
MQGYSVGHIPNVIRQLVACRCDKTTRFACPNHPARSACWMHGFEYKYLLLVRVLLAPKMRCRCRGKRSEVKRFPPCGGTCVLACTSLPGALKCLMHKAHKSNQGLLERTFPGDILMSQSSSSQPGLSRRRWFAGAGAVGAVAAVAAVAPVATAPVAEAAPEPKPAPERGGGYSVSEHVKRYYQTTRV